MKRMLQGLVICAALVAAAANAATPYLAFRSQSVNAARELVGQQSFINRDDMDCFYGVFSITPEFTRSFWPGRLARCIFGDIAHCNDCGATINIVGSQAIDQAAAQETLTYPLRATGWMADYFGLPTTFKSQLTFEPRIWNFDVDLNLYLGLDEWAKGLYFRIHAPLTYTKWNLDVCESCITTSDLGYQAGYFAPVDIEKVDLNENALTFFQGGNNVNLGTVKSPDGTQINDIVFNPLRYSKFPKCGCDGEGKFYLSDIEMALGWNFYTNCDYHLGVEIRASAPTGNKPCAEWLFWPIVGSGGNWKLGGGLSAHAMLWRSEDENASFGFWLEANVQHLFKVCQDRVFDLCGKPNSRYMLAMKMQPQNTGLLYTTAGENGDIYHVFANEYAPVANLTRSSVDVSVPVEGDIVAKFAYTRCNWQWDLGYEFWGRSCEKICPRSNCCSTDIGSWALKGDAFVYGFDEADPYWYPLSSTESKASICSGTNFIEGASIDYANTEAAWYNPRIDNPELAYVYYDNIEEGVYHPLYVNEDPITDIQRTSIQPIMLSDKSIGYDDAQTKGISNKIFTHLSYTWRSDCDVIPFFGIGGSAEFGQSCCTNKCKTNCCNNNCNDNCCNNDCDNTCNDNCCNNNCNDNNNCNNTCTDCGNNCSANCCCQPCALSQWAVWLKGGVAW